MEKHLSGRSVGLKGNYAVNVDSFSKLLFIKMLFIKIDCAGSTSKIVTRKQHDSTMHCTEIAKKKSSGDRSIL